MLHPGHHHLYFQRTGHGRVGDDHPHLLNIVISLLRKIIPGQIRIAAYIVVIAGFVTMVDLLLQAYFQDIAESLGVFIPLIVAALRWV